MKTRWSIAGVVVGVPAAGFALRYPESEEPVMDGSQRENISSGQVSRVKEIHD